MGTGMLAGKKRRKEKERRGENKASRTEQQTDIV